MSCWWQRSVQLYVIHRYSIHRNLVKLFWLDPSAIFMFLLGKGCLKNNIICSVVTSDHHCPCGPGSILSDAGNALVWLWTEPSACKTAWTLLSTHIQKILECSWNHFLQPWKPFLQPVPWGSGAATNRVHKMLPSSSQIPFPSVVVS